MSAQTCLKCPPRRPDLAEEAALLTDERVCSTSRSLFLLESEGPSHFNSLSDSVKATSAQRHRRSLAP